MKKTVFCLFLSALMICPLASCGGSGTVSSGAPAQDGVQNAPAGTEPEETAPETLPSNLPDSDLGGFVLTLFRSGVYFPETGIWRD